MLNHSFVWNGKSSEDFGIKIERFASLNRPARKYTAANVPGRNGMIYDMQDAWEEVIQTYQIWAGGQTKNSPEEFFRIMEWLNEPSGYAELTDSYDTEHYREAIFLDATDVENSWNRYGRALVSFRCRPERFLSNQEKEFSRSNATTVIRTTNATGIHSTLNFRYDSLKTLAKGEYAHWLEDVSFPSTIKTTASVQSYQDEDMTVTAEALDADNYYQVLDASHDDRYGIYVGSNIRYIGKTNTTVYTTLTFYQVRTYDGVVGYVISYSTEKLSNAIELNNPTSHIAKPIIRFSVNEITVNDLVLTVNSNVNKIINCEEESIIDASTGENLSLDTTITDIDGNATGRFLKLKKGMNILIPNPFNTYMTIDTRFWEI